ncbi:hypothetical protein MBM_04918 [Drepanopeziza brunnea f. sp. 'multigermtubi' MB_m1]|uniref:Uncharacterized protein n=1 Tax=Marssonina brunnea f. sp. multigermtubi (strain MB_m1) TaxID=1072389 RepID=K1WWB3_MARBU|nr:uncharacterized protein MBM_04918 [Drepanopeziza brunnea f. sp. 'multigermtubi' MB_m1]EKD17341.1 hypothetical protein MBM_04918 [Drepanopeziza brunnea f. sp. 'multigermtubi' MB_m1]
MLKAEVRESRENLDGFQDIDKDVSFKMRQPRIIQSAFFRFLKQSRSKSIIFFTKKTKQSRKEADRIPDSASLSYRTLNAAQTPKPSISKLKTTLSVVIQSQSERITNLSSTLKRKRIEEKEDDEAGLVQDKKKEASFGIKRLIAKTMSIPFLYNAMVEVNPFGTGGNKPINEIPGRYKDFVVVYADGSVVNSMFTCYDGEDTALFLRLIGLEYEWKGRKGFIDEFGIKHYGANKKESA